MQYLPGPVAYKPWNARHGVTEAASLIAARIREARRLGWVPGEGRGVFITLSGADAP